MHISEGILSPPVLAVGAVLTAVATSYAIRKMDHERIPEVALLSSAFFVASFIHVPLGPSNAHLVLNGLCGLILGWGAFPAILIALFLQAVLFQYGGITTLGINTLSMALPALLSYYLFGSLVRQKRAPVASLSAFACGFLSVLTSALIVALALIKTDKPFTTIAVTIVAAHLPVMLVEGFITAFIADFLRRVKPQILETSHAR